MPRSSKPKPKTEIVSLTLDNVLGERMFCGRSKKYLEMYEAKRAWFKDRFAEGMRYKLFQVDGRNVGFIEYTPGEFVWRGVSAKDYLFIHCFWVLGQSKGKGYGTRLLQDCADDAKHNGFAGVAVATSYEHWLPNRKIFLKQGFEQADTAPPAFELWVKRFDTQSPLPTFNRPSPKAKKMARGLTIYTSDQCPYIAITVQLLTQTAEKLNLPVTLVPIRNCKDAQRSPCVYGVTGVYLDGELVSYHPIGGKQLIEFMEKRDKKT